MAEGAQVENSSLNKKPATECVWDVQYFQNQFYASSLACVECGHPPKKCYMDKDHQTFCRICSEPLITKNVKIDPNPYADGLVAKAEIACSNILTDPSKNDDEKKEETKQCEWKGLVKDWKTHNDTDCPYAIINCNDCCEYLASRSLQEAHHGVCGFAVIKCPLNCNGDILRKDTKDHTEEKCAKTVMNCTNDECKEQPLREVLEHHVNTVCPHRIVECKYNEYGCPQARIKDKDMRDHMTEFETKHIQFQLDRLYQMMNSKISQNAMQIGDEISGVKPGMIQMFGGSMIPKGWIVCDGKNGTPDLRDKFVLNNVDLGDFEISEREYDDDEEEQNEIRIASLSSYSMIYIMKGYES